MRRIAIFVFLGCGLLAGPAQGADRGFYLGGGFGFSSFEAEDFYDEFGELRFEDDSFGIKLFGGYQIIEYLAVEITYSDYGTINKRETSLSGRWQHLDVGIQSIDVSAVGVIPVSAKVGIFAKLGAASWKAGRGIFIRRGEGRPFQGRNGSHLRRRYGFPLQETGASV